MTKEQMIEIFEAIDQKEIKVSRAAKEQFSNDLKARIEAVIAFGRSNQFSKEDVFQLIDETLNAVHPTEEQIREIEKEELP